LSRNKEEEDVIAYDRIKCYLLSGVGATQFSLAKLGQT